jgi:hypothetical protein
MSSERTQAPRLWDIAPEFDRSSERHSDDALGACSTSD